MSCYVDATLFRLGRMRTCHLVADTPEELRVFAARLGCDPAWLQHAGTYKEHYDLPKFRRALAVKLGAIEITWRTLAEILRSKKTTLRKEIA